MIYTSGSTGRPKGVAIDAPQRRRPWSRWARDGLPRRGAGRRAGRRPRSASTSRSSSCSCRCAGGGAVIAGRATRWRCRALPAAAEVTLVNTVPSALAELVRRGAAAAVGAHRSTWRARRCRRALAEALHARPAVGAAAQPLRPDRGHHLLDLARRSTRGEPRAAGRSAGRSPARGSTCSTAGCSRCRVGVPGELLPRRRRPGPRLPRPAGADRRALRARSVRAASRARASTAPATWRAAGRTASSSSSAASTTRSRCAASASSWARSRRRSPATRRCARRRCWRARTRPASARLVAYVVPRRTRRARRRGAARAACASALPELHGAVGLRARCAALPLTPNGKVDRKALPRAATAARPEAAAYGAAARRSRSCWPGSGPRCWASSGSGVARRLLRPRRPLAARHPGGLAAARGASASSCRCARCSRRPTVAGLAARIEAARRGAGAAAAAAARAGAARRRPLPLSFAQQRLWFLDQLEPGQPGLQHARRPCGSRGALDVPALGAALRRGRAPPRGAAHHLRASPTGEPVQVIAPAARPCRCRWSTSRPLPEDARERRGRAARRRGGARGRSTWRAGPLLRGAAAAPRRRRARRCCSTMHHIVSDGWSLGVLVRELAALYAGLRCGPAVAAAASCRSSTPTSPPGSAAGWRARCWTAQLAYWRERLAGAPPVLELPTDRPRPPVQPAPRRARGAVGSRRGLAARAARRSAGGEGATLFMILLAAFEALLCALHAARTDLLVGTPIAGRTRAEIEGLIGFFVNTLVLRAGPGRATHVPRAAGAGCARRRSAPTRTRTCRSSSWSRSCGPERDLSRTPLFQVMFVLQNAPRRPRRRQLPGLTLRPAGVRERDAPSST